MHFAHARQHHASTDAVQREQDQRGRRNPRIKYTVRVTPLFSLLIPTSFRELSVESEARSRVLTPEYVQDDGPENATDRALEPFSSRRHRIQSEEVPLRNGTKLAPQSVAIVDRNSINMLTHLLIGALALADARAPVIKKSNVLKLRGGVSAEQAQTAIDTSPCRQQVRLHQGVMEMHEFKGEIGAYPRHVQVQLRPPDRARNQPSHAQHGITALAVAIFASSSSSPRGEGATSSACLVGVLPRAQRLAQGLGARVSPGMLIGGVSMAPSPSTRRWTCTRFASCSPSSLRRWPSL